jgi:N-acetylmuramoyl-L-alanine amidase
MYAGFLLKSIRCCGVLGAIMMKWLSIQATGLLVGLLLGIGAAAAATVVEDVRAADRSSYTRVVLDLSQAPDHRIFTLEDPHRAVIDLRAGQLDPALVAGIRDEGPIRRVRSGRRGEGVRIVLDLATRRVVEAFTIEPGARTAHRLVIDLRRPGAGSSADESPDRPRNTPSRTASEAGATPFVVAIDAGHGGKDPGAIGAAGTYEKDIVLTVARKLAGRLGATAGIEPVLIRDGDYFVGLRDRTRKAREADADLFVSLHADAFHDRSVRGSSVFVLSRNGASSEMARMLARSENRAHRIGGVSLADKDEQVASVLVDLSRAHTVEESLDVADVLLAELDALGDVHGDGVEQAGFAVLKSLDMPSVLVELAFISNPEEEKRLKSSRYQHQLAEGLTEGVLGYVQRVRPTLASGGGTAEYEVRAGDTLSGIAQQFAVSVGELRQANDLGGDTIVAGHTLKIP